MPTTAHSTPCMPWLHAVGLGETSPRHACMPPEKSLGAKRSGRSYLHYTPHTNFTGTGPSPLGAHTARTASWTLSKSEKP